MINHASYTSAYDIYEYHGNTEVVLTRKRGAATVWKDRILFDSAEEASEYFNNHCFEKEA
jgi:hypothetical protein